MVPLALAVLLLAMTGHSSANWCVCKDGISDQMLQKTIDYACGAGADCNPLRQNGPCWNPNTVKAHCSYAVNSYFQRKGQAQGSCDFAGTAQISSSDPSTAGCAYPASASATGTSTSPTTGTPTMGTPSTGTPSMGTPSTGTPTMGTPSTGTPTMGTPSTGTPTMGTPSTGTSTTTPYSGTPSTGVLGGIGNGIAPSGTGMNTDDSSDGFRLVNTRPLFHLSCLISTGLMMLRLA